jgi:hypothetical protein
MTSDRPPHRCALVIRRHRRVRLPVQRRRMTILPSPTKAVHAR